MPKNFPDAWVNRVEKNLTQATNAPWLDGIAEMDVPVIEIGSGAASESNQIHIPVSDFEVDVLVNNTAYPIALQAFDDDEVVIKLDKYQTKVVTLSDDQILGASYSRIDSVTSSLTDAMLKKKYSKAIHALAAAADTVNTPIIETTGELVGTRKRLIYDDLVALKDKADKLEIPAEGRRLVLCTDHYNDLLLDRKNFGDLLVNYKTGDLAPIIAGFQIYQYVANPYFLAKVKQPYGSAPAGGSLQGSVFFYLPNIAKKTGLTKQYFADSKQDPENQTNRVSYRHYFIVVPKRNKYIGVIASGKSA